MMEAMLGTFRYVLAHMVVVAHLAYTVGMWSGVYAVFSFFVISGYLMAMVLDTTYPWSARGILRFAANRALRIYPPYLLVLTLGLAMALWDPQWARLLGNVRLPDGPVEWLRNIGIFTLHLEPTRTARLVPPSWSLDLELCWYLAMALGLGRSRRIVTVWLLISLAWTVHLVFSGVLFPLRYAQLAPASLPYAAGAALYYYREPIRLYLRHSAHIAVAGTLYVVNAVIPNRIWPSEFLEGFYVSLALTLYLLASLISFDRSRTPRWFQRVDARLGDLSYPVFLCHLPVAPMLAMLDLSYAKGWRLFWIALPLINGIAWLVHWLSERPVVRLRDKVRGFAHGD
ncbi:MAG: acyltransferase [Deltaproteobacteria bacterium]|nr:acyltransferase [Deltaproteobacteria bacterium]MBW2390571.1 acyltransferase [Deltaproteobacteria bacterium]MBW2696392.1 acyltransferase [Deltaproteobacteria bacterium]